MNAIAIGLLTLVAGLLLAGLLLLQRDLCRGRQRATDGRRQRGVESAELGHVKGTHWPDGWRGIPPSGDGDGAGRSLYAGAGSGRLPASCLMDARGQGNKRRDSHG